MQAFAFCFVFALLCFVLSEGFGVLFFNINIIALDFFLGGGGGGVCIIDINNNIRILRRNYFDSASDIILIRHKPHEKENQISSAIC